jgi:hypothetical protein
MSIRNFMMFAVLSVFLFGCVVAPRPFPSRGYDDNYYGYQDSPSYQGYFYSQIIFIGTIPYYVGDDRIVRPIPYRYREHFRRYDYDRLRRPPAFSRDTEVRDGYPVSRIVYLNGVPYHVGDNRRAQALPNNLRDRFRYTPSREGNFNRNDNRIERFDRGQGNRQIEPSGNTRERNLKDRMIFESGRQNGASRDAPPVDMRGMQQQNQERTSPQQIQRNVREQPRTTTREQRKEKNDRSRFDRKDFRDKRDEGRD